MNAEDVNGLIEFLYDQDFTITIEACGHKKRVPISDCVRVVAPMGQTQQIARILAIRMMELARDILHERGELEFSQ